jgi:hypothetical protein
MRILLFIALQLPFYLSFSQNGACRLLDEFKSKNYQITGDTASIPNVIKKIFSEIYSRPFFIANPGEVYNETDIVSADLPRDRLIFSGMSVDGLFSFLYFETGGMGLTNNIIILKNEENQCQIGSANLPLHKPINKLRKLKRYLKCKVENWDFAIKRI